MTFRVNYFDDISYHTPSMEYSVLIRPIAYRDASWLMAWCHALMPTCVQVG